MKMFGVNIAYDEEQTKRFREEIKNEHPPGKLRKVRVYDVTEEYDLFKKFCVASSRRGIVKIHIHKIIRYWLRRLRYFFSTCNPIRQGTSRQLSHKE